MPNRMFSKNICLEKIGSVVQQIAMPVTYIALLIYIYIYIYIYIFYVYMIYNSVRNSEGNYQVYFLGIKAAGA